MKPYCGALLICLSGLSAMAQPYNSTKGSFQVDQKRGCAPLTINLTQLISSTFTGEYNYEGGTTLTLSKTYTYNTPGTYNLLAIYNGLIPNSTDNTDNITIIVTENIQPEFEISACSNSEVSIKVLETQYNTYLVDFNNDNIVDRTIPAGGTQSATFQYASVANQTITVRGQDNNGADNCSKKIKTITPLAALPTANINNLTVVDAQSTQLDYTPNQNIQYRVQIAVDNFSSFQIFQSFNSAVSTAQTLSIPSLSSDDHYYCFRLNAYDPCNNTNAPSNTICSVNLDLNIVSNVNQLTWATAASGVTNFTIKRDQVNYQITTGINFNDATPAIVCNTDYCYQVVVNYSNGARSTSLEKCGTSFSSDTPAAIENASAAFNGDELDLEWEQDPAFTAKSYSINRSRNNGPFNSIGSSNASSFTDNTFSATESYCYNINYLDVCDNTSPDGGIICPIILSGSVASENFVNLSWTEYKGWKDGVKQYGVTKFDINGNQLATFTTTDLSLEDNLDDPDHQVVEYLVTAMPNDAAQSNSVSNRFRITKQARLIFPTAFTPNKDKLNDSFTVVGQYVDNITLQIFDRWGTLIYSTDTNEPWDGTQQGRLMPESTYIWKALITDKTGKALTKIGSVALLRK